MKAHYIKLSSWLWLFKSKMTIRLFRLAYLVELCKIEQGVVKILCNTCLPTI